MSGQGKIIHLSSKDINGQSGKPQAAQLIEEVRAVSIKHLNKIIQQMFDSADDTLFEMAEKSENNSEQSIYFDSMRIVRIQRKEIEENFSIKLETLFENIWRIQPEEKVRDELSVDDLELVGNTDLEESLAITTLAGKIKNRFSQELNALGKRVNHILPQSILHEEINPLLPVNICNVFSEATQTLEMDIKIKLIIFKLFDQHIISEIGNLYDEVNNIFIKAGVLPKIKISIKKQEAHKSASTPAPAANSNAEQQESPVNEQTQEIIIDPTRDEGEILVSLQQLLTSTRAQQGSPGSGVSGNQGIPVASATPAAGQPPGVAPSSTSDVLTALTNMQKNITALSDAMGDSSADQMSGQIRTTLFSNLSAQTGASASHINTVDNELIDVVAILFEYILEDQNLADSVKGLIARLQIPMLKVALINKELFSTKGHPARRLLNEIARAGLEVDDSDTLEENALLQKIEEVVERITNEFVEDIELFSTLLDEFQDFFESYQQELSDITSANPLLQEKEELALAKSWVITTLNNALSNKVLSQEVVDIISGPWKDVMLHTYLNEGPDSTLWKNQLRFIDVLAWSLQPKKLAVDRSKLGRIIQHLVNTLKRGLQEIDFPAEQIEQIFSTLEPIHYASLKGVTVEEDNKHDNNQQNAELMSSIRKYDPDATYFLYEKNKPEQQPLEQQTGSQSAVDDAITEMQQQISSLPDIDDILEQDAEDEFVFAEYEDKVIMEDIVLSGWDEHDQDEEYPDDEYLEIARHLEAGKWLEFTDQHHNKKRARLAWKSEFLGEYTFMNWKFDVVADRTLNGLAADLRAGTARVIDDVPVLDRALSAVLSGLSRATKSSGD